MNSTETSAAAFPSGARIFQRMYTRLGCQGRPPDFVAEFFPYAGLTNTIRLRDHVAHVRLSDVLQSAPRDVVEAAAAILLSRLYRKKTPRPMVQRYREFLTTRATLKKLSRLRKARTRPLRFHPRGDHHSLQPLFEKLNRRYFRSALRKPKLGWSVQPWRSQLGCFDPALNQIVLSSTLDEPGVPRHVVEYVLYHEMLHMKHPVKRATCGLSAHSPEFRKEERRFGDFEKARRFLTRSF